MTPEQQLQKAQIILGQVTEQRNAAMNANADLAANLQVANMAIEQLQARIKKLEAKELPEGDLDDPNLRPGGTN